MHFWPQSSTLSEDGPAAAAAPSGGSKAAGGGSGSIFSSGAGMPVVNAGEIMLSRAESAALAALETEPDEKHGRLRARKESGLTDQQISALKRRADHALSKGLTLKGVGFTRKPTGGPPDEPSLLKKAKAEEKVVTEQLRERYRNDQYGLPEHSDYKFPAPHSGGREDSADSFRVLSPRERMRSAASAEEANAQSTLAKLTVAARRRRRA